MSLKPVLHEPIYKVIPLSPPRNLNRQGPLIQSRFYRYLPQNSSVPVVGKPCQYNNSPLEGLSDVSRFKSPSYELTSQSSRSLTTENSQIRNRKSQYEPIIPTENMSRKKNNGTISTTISDFPTKQIALSGGPLVLRPISPDPYPDFDLHTQLRPCMHGANGGIGCLEQECRETFNKKGRLDPKTDQNKRGYARPTISATMRSRPCNIDVNTNNVVKAPIGPSTNRKSARSSNYRDPNISTPAVLSEPQIPRDTSSSNHEQIHNKVSVHTGDNIKEEPMDPLYTSYYPRVPYPQDTLPHRACSHPTYYNSDGSVDLTRARMLRSLQNDFDQLINTTEMALCISRDIMKTSEYVMGK